MKKTVEMGGKEITDKTAVQDMGQTNPEFMRKMQQQ